MSLTPTEALNLAAVITARLDLYVPCRSYENHSCRKCATNAIADILQREWPNDHPAPHPTREAAG